MTRINDVYSYLCELAPLELQMSFDNAGFQLGRVYENMTEIQKEGTTHK